MVRERARAPARDRERDKETEIDVDREPERESERERESHSERQRETERQRDREMLLRSPHHLPGGERGVTWPESTSRGIEKMGSPLAASEFPAASGKVALYVLWGAR
jgi:hypothetical protein